MPAIHQFYRKRSEKVRSDFTSSGQGPLNETFYNVGVGVVVRSGMLKWREINTYIFIYFLKAFLSVLSIYISFEVQLVLMMHSLTQLGHVPA